METKTRYKKSDAIKQLERQADEAARAKHPSVDPKYLAPRTYSDKTANNLTRAVIDFLNLNGHLAERINSTGRYQDNSKTFQDVMGRTRTIGTGQWLPTSGLKGTADISATINGRSVKIEIKIRDAQSQAQKEYQKRIEAAGGVYLIVRSFEQFKDWYSGFIATQRAG